MKFDYNRLRFGELVAAGCAILLFFCLFLNWYSVNIGGRAAGRSAFGGRRHLGERRGRPSATPICCCCC